jgi:hypothetical protein
MPGIEVNTDGTILYQGNAINKFYVNGKDLWKEVTEPSTILFLKMPYRK